MIPVLIILQACAVQPTKIQMDIKTSISEHDGSTITFESPNSSFSYICQHFSPNEHGELKARFAARPYDAPIGYISIQDPSTKLREGIKLSQPESLEKLASVNMFSSEVNGIKGSNQTIYSYDSSTVKQFINDCINDFQKERTAFIKKIEKDIRDANLRDQQHKEEVFNAITSALKKHNKSGINIGGELVIKQVLLDQRYEDKAGYRSFLENKNTAYVIDFSEYVIKQSLGKNQYVLRHIIEDYYYPAIVPPLPIILKTKKQLFEGETPDKNIVIYTGVKVYQTVAGASKQLLSFESID